MGKGTPHSKCRRPMASFVISGTGAPVLGAAVLLPALGCLWCLVSLSSHLGCIQGTKQPNLFQNFALQWGDRAGGICPEAISSCLPNTGGSPGSRYKAPGEPGRPGPVSPTALACTDA